MRKSYAMGFGTSGKIDDKKTGLKLVESKEINDSTSVTLDLDAGGFYLLAIKEYKISDLTYRGHRLITIAASELPDGDLTRGNAYASSNAGVSVSTSSNSIILSQSSATYGFRYALYKMF